MRNRDFRKELEERERIDKGKRSSCRAIQPFRKSTVFSTKRQKLDQVPAASFDAVDPFEDEESHSDSNEESDPDEDDTAAILAELQRIKKKQAVKQTKKVSIQHYNDQAMQSQHQLYKNI